MIWLRKGRQVAFPKDLGFANITAMYLALVLQTWDPDWLATADALARGAQLFIQNREALELHQMAVG